MKIKLKKIVGNLFYSFENCTREWKCHLEIFSRPQVKENSRQYLLLRTDILQKTVRRWVPLAIAPPIISPGFFWHLKVLLIFVLKAM